MTTSSESEPHGPYDTAPPSMFGAVQPPTEQPESSACPQAQFHGKPFRYCSCGWTEPQPVHDCARDGHDYEHVIDGTGELLKIVCGACPAAWKVEPT